MGALKITWINPDRIVLQGKVPTSPRVDVRLRCILPGAELARRGHHVEAIAMCDLGPPERLPESHVRDVYVIGKTLFDVQPFVRRIRQSNARVILDLCDNVFEPPEDGPRPFTQALLPQVDGIVTSTEQLRDAVAPHLPSDLPVAIIPDCVEGTRQAPHFSPAPDRLKLLWFGYPNNLPHLQRLLPLLAALPLAVELTIVTWWDWRLRMGFQGNPHGIQTRLVDWSPENTAAELARSDMVVLPSSLEPAFRTRSPNRIITALLAGRFVAAFPLPSYKPFAAFAGLGEDLPAQIMAALRDPGGTLQRISAGQEFIAAQFNNESIADRWEAFVLQIRSGR